MRVLVTAKYNMTVDNELLGYSGENRARVIDITYPAVSGNFIYYLYFEYNDGTVYAMVLDKSNPINGVYNAKVAIENGYLKDGGKVKMQWVAKEAVDGEDVVIAKSNIVQVSVAKSIASDEESPVPAPEITQELYEKIINALGGLTLATMSKTDYDALETKDANTVYFVINDEAGATSMSVMLNGRITESFSEDYALTINAV